MTDRQGTSYWLEAIWDQLERIADAQEKRVDQEQDKADDASPLRQGLATAAALTPPPYPKPGDHVVRDRQAGEYHSTARGVEPEVLAAVYFAVSPDRPAGLSYVEYLALPLSYRLVQARFYPETESMDTLIDWCTEVGEAFEFDPAEVFVIRDSLAFEARYSDRILRAYSRSMLNRRLVR